MSEGVDVTGLIADVSFFLAFDLVKAFPKVGGAILAVDVESWDQDHDVGALTYKTCRPFALLIMAN